MYLLPKVLQGLNVTALAQFYSLVYMKFASANITFDNVSYLCYRIRYQGHALAKELASRGLQTTVITDSAVFAMISRVNMVHTMISLYFYVSEIFHFDWENLLFKGYSGSTCCHG